MLGKKQPKKKLSAAEREDRADLKAARAASVRSKSQEQFPGRR